MNIWPYVYCIKNTVTGEFYFGSRYANVKRGRTPSQDLFYFYRSSSIYVKEQIRAFGIAAFTFEVVFSYDDFKDGFDKPTLECFWKEQELIKENSKDLKCMNRKFIDKDTAKGAWCAVGRSYPKSQEHKEKIKQSNIGKNAGKKCSDETKAKLSKSNSGRKHSAETVERIKNLVKGFKHTEKTCENMSVAAKLKWAKRSAAELARISALTSKALKENHANRTEEQKEITRRKKIESFAAQTPERREEINSRRSEAAKRRWASFRRALT